MNCGAAGTEREAKSTFTFVSESGAPFTVAGLTKPIERAGIASRLRGELHTAKTIPPAVVASALRSSAGANKHEFGAHTDPDAPLHLALAGQASPSAVGVAGAFSCWPHTNTPLRSCRPSAQADQTGVVSRHVV